MSATGIGATGKLPFLREIFRLELLALSGRGVQNSVLDTILNSLEGIPLRTTMIRKKQNVKSAGFCVL